MINSNRDDVENVWPDTTFSVEDWEGTDEAPSTDDPLRVLLAVADDAASTAAVMVAGWLAQRHHLHPIAVHVLDLDLQPMITTTQRLAGTVEKLGGLPTRWPLDVEAGRPSETILASARAFDANLVVLGRHQRCAPACPSNGHPPEGKEGVNVPQLVMTAEQVPVLAVHRDCLELPKRVVVAVDFRRASLSAAQLACAVADTGSTVYLIHVYAGRSDGEPHSAAERESAARGIGSALAKFKQILSKRSDITVKTVMLLGDPLVELHSFLRHIRPDLTALGTNSGATDDGPRLGSVTAALLDDPYVSSVLVAPAAPRRRSRV